MNTPEVLAQAFDDFSRGRMGTIPAAHIGNQPSNRSLRRGGWMCAAGWEPFRRRTSATNPAIGPFAGEGGTRRSADSYHFSRMAVRSYAGTVRAPDFPEGLDWLNVSRPLHIQDLRGRLAIIDFWTFC